MARISGVGATGRGLVGAGVRGPRRRLLVGTSAANSQGLCEACNYVKEEPGWPTGVSDDGAVETTTPTGHIYTTRPPPTARRLRAEDEHGPPVLSTAG